MDIEQIDSEIASLEKEAFRIAYRRAELILEKSLLEAMAAFHNSLGREVEIPTALSKTQPASPEPPPPPALPVSDDAGSTSKPLSAADARRKKLRETIEPLVQSRQIGMQAAFDIIEAAAPDPITSKVLDARLEEAKAGWPIIVSTSVLSKCKRDLGEAELVRFERRGNIWTLF